MRKICILTVMSLFSVQAFTQEITEYLLENEAVNHFLNDFVYDSNDYTYTRVLDYADPYPLYNVVSYRKDQPNPVPIKLSAPLDTIGTLYISEKSDYSKAITRYILKGKDSTAVYNLIPGKTYNWKVEVNTAQGETQVVESGKFKTTGTVRMIKADGIFNVRDLGGWTGLKGYPIRYGKLIRGSRMSNNGSGTSIITSEGVDALLEVGIKADLDLRTSSERNISSSPLGSSVSYAYENNSYASRIYTFDDDGSSISGIKKIISWFKEDKPVYFHCSVGADRTGTIAFLIGALCGMSEDALSKDYEMTSFSPDYVVTNGKVEDLRRIRTAHGRYDNTEDSYKYALMIEKVKKFPGETLQEKVYYHLNTGKKSNGQNLTTGISAADLDWLISYLLNPIDLNVSGTVRMTKGMSKQVEAELVTKSELNPDAQITFTSSDPRVATVSETGLVTALAGGTTVISASVDGFSKTFTVNVPLVESTLPDSVYFATDVYSVSKSTNAVTNGSFEYADKFNSWKSATGGALSDQYFEVAEDAQTGERYLVCKASGDAASPKSIRMEWGLAGNKTFVLGFRIKNTSGQRVDANANLQVSLIRNKPEVNASGDDFVWDTDPVNVISRVDSRMDATLLGDYLIFNEKPSYDGEWTEVQYVFCNPSTDRFRYLQLLFTNLGDENDQICLDNLYLAEIKFVHGTSVQPVTEAAPYAGTMYNLGGQKTDSPSGIIIMNGKKYLLK